MSTIENKLWEESGNLSFNKGNWLVFINFFSMFLIFFPLIGVYPRGTFDQGMKERGYSKNTERLIHTYQKREARRRTLSYGRGKEAQIENWGYEALIIRRAKHFFTKASTDSDSA